MERGTQSVVSLGPQPLTADERAAIRAIALVQKEHEAGRITADEATRRIGQIVAAEGARTARSAV